MTSPIILSSLFHLKCPWGKQRKNNDSTLSRPNWQRHKRCICLIKKVTGNQTMQQKERAKIQSRATAFCLYCFKKLIPAKLSALLPTLCFFVILLKYAFDSLYYNLIGWRSQKNWHGGPNFAMAYKAFRRKKGSLRNAGCWGTREKHRKPHRLFLRQRLLVHLPGNTQRLQGIKSFLL